MRVGDVKPFRYVYADDRQQFTRPLEEAAEFFVAWHFWIQRRDSQRYSAKAREKMLDKAGFAYENLTAEEHPDLCREYGIKGAPTLVLSDGVHFEKYYGVAEIKKLLAETAQKAE